MKKQLLIALLSLLPLLGATQERDIINFAAPIVADDDYVKPKVTRKLGIYITDIYNLNSAEGTFSAEFRMWSYGPPTAEAGYLEFNHSQNTKFTGAQVIHHHDSLWRQAHVSATYHFDWDMTHFPFDTQTLRIECENSIDRSFVELDGDIKNSGITPNAIQSGFVITDVRFFNQVQHTSTNFGNPLMGPDEECSFSCYVAEIDIRRESPWTLFLKIFSAVIVSFFIATITFVVNPRHFDARLSLTVGALFAAVGSKFIVDSLVGISNEFMLMDRIYILTYAMIFLVAVLLLISHKLYQDADDQQANHILLRYFDLGAFCTLNVGYIACIGTMIATA